MNNIQACLGLCNTLIPSIKVPLIIKPPGPNPKFSEYIFKEPIHIVIKTPEILNLPRPLRTRVQLWGWIIYKTM